MTEKLVLAVEGMKIGSVLEVVLAGAGGYLYRTEVDSYKYTCKRGVPDNKRPYPRFVRAPEQSAIMWEFWKEDFQLASEVE